MRPYGAAGEPAASPQMHRNLAKMYIADGRFERSYEKVAPGLAGYVDDAVVANADTIG